MSLLIKVWMLLNYKQKKYVIFIFMLMFLAMILEALSVGIILPLLSIFLKGDTDISLFSYFFAFGKLTGKNLIFMGLLITFLIFLMKNLTLIFNAWHQSKFIQKIRLELTSKLFKYYLKKEYIFFLQSNSAHLYRNLTESIEAYLNHVRMSMILFGEIIIFMGIAFVLFYVDFLGTIIILFSVSVAAFTIYILARKKLTLLGQEKKIISGELNKHLLQGIASVKDVKILDREEDLIYQVDKNLVKWARLNHFFYFISALPRFLFEILTVSAFLILVLLMMSLRKDMVDIILYLGVFAVATYRIVPAATRILSSFQSLRFGTPLVELLLQEFDTKDNSYSKKNYQSKSDNILLKFQKEINLKNLSFSYPTRKDFSLSKISITVKKGDVIGIIGETGSGKSTLINLLIGLLKPSEGKVEVDQLNINSNLAEWHKKIGYVPQSVYLTDDTIRKNIAFGLRENDIDDDLIKKAIEKTRLNEFLNNLPDGLETIVGEKGIRFSSGQQQRIGIARALYRDPEILILDEATSSLDQLTEKKIMESLQFLKGKKTLIIVTHRLVTVKDCDKIFFIDKGRITKQGPPEKILINT